MRLLAYHGTKERTTATSHRDTGTKTEGPSTGTTGRGHPCSRARTGQDTRAPALHSSSAAMVPPSSVDGASTFYGTGCTYCTFVWGHLSLCAIQQLLGRGRGPSPDPDTETLLMFLILISVITQQLRHPPHPGAAHALHCISDKHHDIHTYIYTYTYTYYTYALRCAALQCRKSVAWGHY